MKIAIGSDHAGFKLKETIKNSITGVEFVDVGAFSEESTDYPDHIAALSRLVQRGEAQRGIGICGTGIGASITANKFGGIRAALCTNLFMAEMSRLHNDANVLILGARVIEDAEAVTMVRAWVETPFEGGRHQRRLDKIKAIECGG
ncbi:MAG: ribose 5-phosphate isomerase B [Spirochaetes bacterium]|jgi:ribose 5-phosphate isomerase B|nr:ribose 5-phosphate isomerase B [Spirochaetota bacterium]